MAPTPDELEDLVLSARFGDLEDVQAFADAHGWEAAAGARDDRGNSALHMACGNGHVGECAGPTAAGRRGRLGRRGRRRQRAEGGAAPISAHWLCGGLGCMRPMEAETGSSAHRRLHEAADLRRPQAHPRQRPCVRACRPDFRDERGALAGRALGRAQQPRRMCPGAGRGARRVRRRHPGAQGGYEGVATGPSPGQCGEVSLPPPFSPRLAGAS